MEWVTRDPTRCSWTGSCEPYQEERCYDRVCNGQGECVIPEDSYGKGGGGLGGGCLTDVPRATSIAVPLLDEDGRVKFYSQKC